jgi:hypothetical protein
VRVFALAILAVAPFAMADWPVAVHLALDEARVLPRIPTGLTITVTNHGQATLRLPSVISLTATNAQKQTFILDAYSQTMRDARVPEAERDVPAGGSRSSVLIRPPSCGDHRG